MRHIHAGPARRDGALAALLLTALLLPCGSARAQPPPARVKPRIVERVLASVKAERRLAELEQGVKHGRHLLERARRPGVKPPRQAMLLTYAAKSLFRAQADAAQALRASGGVERNIAELGAIRSAALTMLDEVVRAFEDGPAAAVEAAYRKVHPPSGHANRWITQSERDPRYSKLLEVVNSARWAPSPDNLQPWGFEIADAKTFDVVGHDPMKTFGPYDRKRHAYWTSLGALLENVRIAARAQGLEATLTRPNPADDASPRFRVTLVAPNARTAPSAGKTEIALVDMAAILFRTTQRRPMSRRALRQHEKAALEASVGDGYRVVWLETPVERREMATLNALTGKLRLTTGEAREVHARIVDAGDRSESPHGGDLSPDRVPANAVGLDAVTKRLMLSLLDRPRLLAFANRYLGGTVLPVLELDKLPALFTGTHFLIMAKGDPPQGLDDYLAAGAATQRFWLTATTLGLQLQPTYMPRALAAYSRHDEAGGTEGGPNFSSTTEGQNAEITIRRRLKVLAEAKGAKLDNIVFLGRTGDGNAPKARSLRLPLEALIQGRAPAADEGHDNESRVP